MSLVMQEKIAIASFIWRYFYCAYLGPSLWMDSNVQVGEVWTLVVIDSNDLPLAGKLTANFLKNVKSPPHALPSPPPPTPTGLTLIGALS